MIMDVKVQQYICALADTGSYHQAAKLTFTSQPNLSIQIKKLEEALGLQLFYRKGKQVVPTYCGQLVIDSCRQMLELDKGLEQRLSLCKRNITGLLRIGTFLRLSPFLLPTLVASFLKKYPQIDVQITTGHLTELMQSLESGRLDIVLCNQMTLDPRFKYVQLKKDHLLLAVSPSNPAVEQSKHLKNFNYPYLKLDTLKEQRFILQENNQMIRQYTNAAFQYSNFQPLNTLVVTNIETAVQMASEGIGAAFAMESYINTIRTNKPINYFLTGDTNRYAYFCGCYAKERTLSEFFLYFISLMQHSLSPQE